MKRLILFVVVGAAILVSLSPVISFVSAADKKPLKNVNVDSLTAETQKSIGSADAMNLVWIVPIEFWQASLAQDATLTDFQRKAVLDALDKYVLFGVVRADVSPLGAMSFHGEKKVFGTLTVSVAKGKGEPVALTPLLKPDNVDTQVVLDSIRPVLKAALGKMGDNFHLFVCSNKDAAGRPIVSPYEDAVVKVGLGEIGRNKGGTIEFQFPLDTLHAPRVCGCGKEAHISWSYCPFCGKKHAK